MRVFVAGVATEVNTFSPIFIGLENFKATMYARPGEHDDRPTLTSSPLIHARRRAAAGEFELVEGTITWTDPGGLINRSTYETIRDEILGQLRAAMPVDGVALCLHGAMVAQGYDDPEGDLIARVREIVGPKAIIAGGLDPHSHLTAKRVANADILVAFKEFPHTDFVERGAEVVDLMVRTMRGEIRPRMSVFDCRMIDVFPTSRQPMRSFVDKMFAIERDDPKVLSLSLIHGFMAGDVPELGTRMLVITDGDAGYGERLAETLGREVFAMRGKSMPELVSPEVAIARARAVGRGPVVIADFWDNPGGGVAGDATVILRALIDAKVPNAALATIWDPIAVGHCMVAGEGAVVPLRFGAKSAPNCGEPLDAVVTVRRLVRDAHQTFGTMRVAMGDCAVIEVGGIEVILNCLRSQAFERTVFTAVGIDPLAKDVLVVKSTNHFHADFAKFASEIIYCQAGRPYPSDPPNNGYRKARQTIWPIVENPFAQ
ncbi:MAG: M81 family metallopeptidase [Devosia nanyangense]|uniref:Microcystinase C n=1 Tax=Devosia nanyangense TaxID=1228055 RepID=A0A933KZI5_9HYPH|nr:M81 family metallopeptidase [Devosia nanyangense]